MGRLGQITAWFKEKTILRKLVLRNTPLFRRLIWDHEYKRGSWDHIDHPPDDACTRFIRGHLGGGSLLDLGCGTGRTVEALGRFSRYTGVDVSRVAIDRGRELYRGRDNVVLVADDIATYEDDHRYDVILWSEVIYYFEQEKILPILKRYQGLLTGNGVQIVQVYSKQQKEEVVKLIRENFTIIAEHDTRYPDGNTSVAMAF